MWPVVGAGVRIDDGFLGSEGVGGFLLQAIHVATDGVSEALLENRQLICVEINGVFVAAKFI